ncbi:metal-dependent transcriptional regulator [Halomicrobium salinisoli]|uniref:metal-dependent transcriptional regulator n=1 Tax=Halomicrobium salinisoli TaxID=2878391 RepID=UPI001CF0C703|nr:metal-dependent transcriptional regulator [Halomicrobium salinisoli]
MSESRTSTSATPRSETGEVERGAARYLFAIAVLSADGKRVSTGELREYLDVTPASASEMVARLAERGLADYESYQGVRLTDRGTAVAERVARQFCVVSTFFESEPDLEVDDRTAFDVAFALPSDGLSSLRDLVGASCLGLCPESGGEADDCHA